MAPVERRTECSVEANAGDEKEKVARAKALLLVMGADADIARKAPRNFQSRGCTSVGDARSKSTPPARPGDWECPVCGENVFASKSACFKCGATKQSGDYWKQWSANHEKGAASRDPASAAVTGREKTVPNRIWPTPNPAAIATLLLGKKRICGNVRRYSTTSEYGFISGEEVDQYLGEGCNVFMHRNALEDAEVAGSLLGAKVSFVVKLSREGKPQAREIQVVQAVARVSRNRLCNAMDVHEQPEKRYYGRIKSFDETTGYGFVVCLELHGKFGRDVFLHHSKRGGFEVGAAISFQIDIDPVRGAPKARELLAASASDNIPPLEQLAETLSINSKTHDKVSDSGLTTPPPAEPDLASSQSTHSPKDSDEISMDSCPPATLPEPIGEPDAKSDAQLETNTNGLLGVPTPLRAPPCQEAAHETEIKDQGKWQDDSADPWSSGNDPWSARATARTSVATDPWSSGHDPWSGGADARPKITPKSKAVVETDDFHKECAITPDDRCASAASPSVELPEPQPSTEACSKAASDENNIENNEAAFEADERDDGEELKQPCMSSVWQRYLSDDDQGAWWWRAEDGSWFVESEPDPWCKFLDPASNRCYWFKDDEEWFWADSGSMDA